MHKHKKHKRGYFPYGMIWWIFFAIMFTKGEWLPWFLIPLGFWLVFGFAFKEETQKPEKKNPPETRFESIPELVVTKPAFTPSEPIHNALLLPTTCSKCGAPVSPYEVKWTGANSAACTYCGSGLQMKK